jgi:tetrathionate reductase subunit B
MVSFEYMYDIIFHVKWPIYIAMYIFFAGMSAGLFIVSTAGNLFKVKGLRRISRIGVVVALVLLVLAMLFLIVDLEQPTKAYTTISYINPASVMSWGVCLLMVYPVMAAVHAWFTFRADFARLVKKNARNYILRAVFSVLTLGQRDLSRRSLARDARYARLSGLIGIPLALMVGSYTGFILAVIDAGVMWNTVLMPLLFLTSAIVSGMSILMVSYAIFARYISPSRKVDPRPMRTLSVFVAWALVVELALFLCEMIVLSNEGAAARDAVWLLTQGPLAFSFIVVEIIIGAFIPIAIIAIPSTGRRTGFQVLAAAMVLSGILAMRFNIIIGGQYLPVAGGELLTYSLTVEELLKVLGVVSVGVVLVYVAFKLLPMEPLRVVKTVPSPAVALPAAAPAEAPPDGAGMDRRTFVRAALGVGAVLVGAYTGLVSLGRVSSPLGSAEATGAGGHRGRYAMVIDLCRCMGCHSCTQACKDTYNLPTGAWRSWVTKIRKSDGRNEKSLFLPRLCNQCEHPPCVKVCPVGATYQDENGVVMQRYDRCIGCKYCMMACPYGMRFVHHGLKAVDKCTFCNHRVKKGLEPACVTACPAGARVFGDLDDNTSEVSRLVTTRPTTVLKPDLGTEPMVFYLNGDSTLMESGLHERM